MLQNMHIKNLALIDEIDIDFGEGLNILTGETGAGKSIVIGSLGICLGGKFQKELLRDQTKDGLVELSFYVEDDRILEELKKQNVSLEDDRQVLISRRLSANGRVVNRINGDTVNLKIIKDVASTLINLHAQHEQQTLLKPNAHIKILDKFGGEEIKELIDTVNSEYNTYTLLKKELDSMSMDENERKKQLDFLRYQIEEIEAANLKEQEIEEVSSRYKKISNSKEIMKSIDEVYSITGYEINSAGDLIGRAVGLIQKAILYDCDLESISTLLNDIDGMLNDLNRDINQYVKNMEFDEGEFYQLEERLNTINSLRNKYGSTVKDINDKLASYKDEYERLKDYEAVRLNVEEKLNASIKRLDASSDKLSKKRKEVAALMCAAIRDSLLELNFSTVMFDMSFTKSDRYSPSGTDEAHFIISTNAGQEMRPLYEVASGGELSRVMLAIKSTLANEDDTPTLIFDEIDVGISGRTAQKVAEQISKIGKYHQVLCITHLPQIAAMSDEHFLIEKNVKDNNTITTISMLDEKSEVLEIARLLGGAEITETTMQAAKEMKDMAKKAKLG